MAGAAGGTRAGAGRPTGSTRTEGWERFTVCVRPSVYAESEDLRGETSRSQYVADALSEKNARERRRRKRSA